MWKGIDSGSGGNVANLGIVVKREGAMCEEERLFVLTLEAAITTKSCRPAESRNCDSDIDGLKDRNAATPAGILAYDPA